MYKATMMWLKTNESFPVQIYGRSFDSQPVLEPISASAAIECRSEVRFSILPKCDIRYRKNRTFGLATVS